jgi:ABC-type branched-subunit amino acid transport system permease subunit
MWAFFSRRLRLWLLVAIVLPVARAVVHRLAVAAERRDPLGRAAKALRQADSAVTAVSRRASRRSDRRKARR